jgi:hypothetical protein
VKKSRPAVGNMEIHEVPEIAEFGERTAMHSALTCSSLRYDSRLTCLL